jgi:hypothetical protein
MGKIWAKLLLALLIALGSSGLGAAPGIRVKAAEAGSAAFRLVPEQSTVYTGTDTVLRLEGVDMQDVFSFEAVLAYDPADIQIVKTTGALEGGLSPGLMDQNGKAVFAFTKTGNTSGVSGTAPLAVFTVRGLQAGVADIRLVSLKTINSSLTKEELYEGNQVELTVTKRAESTPDSPPESAPPPVVSPGAGDTAGIKRGPDETQGPYRKAVFLLAEEWLKQQNSTGSAAPLVIRLPDAGAVNGYILSFPASWINGAASGRPLQIESVYGTVTLPPHMLVTSGIPSGQTASFSLTRLLPEHIPALAQNAVAGYPAYGLELAVDGKPLSWSNPAAPVTVALSYTPSGAEAANPESIIIRYVDEQGAASVVPGGRYHAASGQIVFRATHFSLYAVGFKAVAFRDLHSVEWARTAIGALAARNILNGTGYELYSPELPVKRGDFVKLLAGALELSSPGLENAADFADVEAGSYYYNSIKLARQLGIAEGGLDNRFLPEAAITRQEVMALMDRALRLTRPQESSVAPPASILQPFADREELADYAAPGAARLVSLGYIQGYGGKLHPHQPMTRAEAAVLIDAILK